MSLTRLAWRSLLARPLRSALTVAGIGLGVGVLFASIATSAAIDSSIDRTVDDLVGRAELRVGTLLERGLSARTVEDVQTASGVAAAAPVVLQHTYLQSPVGAPSLPAPVVVLGIDPELDALVHDRSVVEGAMLSRRDEATVVITETLAREDGYGLGSEVTLQGRGGSETFRVVGILAGSGPLVGSAGRTVLVPLQAATRVFDLAGVTWLDIAIYEERTVADVEASLVASLATEPYVLSTPRQIADGLRASTAEFQGTTALIAAVALLVGALLIFNTVSMTLVERGREVGLLRAAGATRRQVMGFVLAGAIVLGEVGSLAGLAFGMLIAAFIAGQVETVSSIATGQFEIPVLAFLVSLLVGFVVTLVAALEPAWRASRVSPIEALRGASGASPAGPERLGWLVAVFGAIAVTGLLLWPQAAGEAGLVRALAVYAVLLAATLLSPFLLGPLARLAGAPFALLRPFEERLARGSLLRNRGRAALTVGALTAGLAMIVALGGVAHSLRLAATEWIAGVVPGDVIATSIRPIGPDEGVEEALRSVEGVERVTPIATFDVAFRGTRIGAMAAVGADLDADGRLAFLAGDRSAAFAALDLGGTAILPRSQAERLDLGVGDSLELPIGGGDIVVLAVSGIVERTMPGDGGEAVLVGWTDAAASFGVLGADFFAVRFAQGAAPAATAVLRGEARLLALEVASLDGIQGAVSDALAKVFRLFDALASVAVVVAALGIVNTLTMNVVERVREIGVLRATGMTRRQVGRMVTVEAGILGLLGALLGTVAGLAAGGLMVALTGLRVPVESLPVASIALAFGLGLGASMLAAYYPARLAGRLSIVRAVKFE